jgi:acetylornithine/succinyldiaminopimelate/putrescine aminotransferase
VFSFYIYFFSQLFSLLALHSSDSQSKMLGAVADERGSRYCKFVVNCKVLLLGYSRPAIAQVSKKGRAAIPVSQGKGYYRVTEKREERKQGRQVV